MEILYIILGFILGGVLAYFIVKSSSVSRKIHDELNQNFIKKEADLRNSEIKISEISESLKLEKEAILSQTEILNQLKTELAKTLLKAMLKFKKLQNKTNSIKNKTTK
jgi:DNA recombination protein RmuC